MQQYEIEFLDNYKRLDAICADMYSCRNGVSEYIAQMEQTPTSKRYKVPMWNEDYRTLKHLRWLRNQITHETTASDCNYEDVVNVKKFFNRILKQQDSLAFLYKLELMEQQKKRPATNPTPISQNNTPHTNYRNILFGTLVGAAVLMLIIIFIKLIF